jgi:hypothetical protein
LLNSILFDKSTAFAAALKLYLTEVFSLLWISEVAFVAVATEL